MTDPRDRTDLCDLEEGDLVTVNTVRHGARVYRVVDLHEGDGEWQLTLEPAP